MSAVTGRTCSTGWAHLGSVTEVLEFPRHRQTEPGVRDRWPAEPCEYRCPCAAVDGGSVPPTGVLAGSHRTPTGDLRDDDRCAAGVLWDAHRTPTGHRRAAWPELMGIYDAAAYLGVSKSALYKALSDGQIPARVYLIGNTKRLARRQLDAWLALPPDESSNPPTSETATVRATTPRRVYGELEELFSRGERGASR